MPAVVPTATILRRLGESVTWTPTGGAATTIRAVILRDMTVILDNYQQQVTMAHIPAVYPVAEGDTIVAGTTFQVSRVWMQNDSNWIRAQLAPWG